MKRFLDLPNELIGHILSYTEHFKFRKGEIVQIIPEDDPRREMMRNIPKIDSLSHVALIVQDKIYDFHIMVTVLPTAVHWNLYKYYFSWQMYDVYDIMDGVVFSMERQLEPSEPS
jgi:hypothetical protein